MISQGPFKFIFTHKSAHSYVIWKRSLWEKSILLSLKKRVSLSLSLSLAFFVTKAPPSLLETFAMNQMHNSNVMKSVNWSELSPHGRDPSNSLSYFFEGASQGCYLDTTWVCLYFHYYKVVIMWSLCRFLSRNLGTLVTWYISYCIISKTSPACTKLSI